MELSWSDEGTLKFGVHLKLNQQLKYLNAGSAHTPGCFKAIMTGVCSAKKTKCQGFHQGQSRHPMAG
jgi:hypothetical protein